MSESEVHTLENNEEDVSIPPSIQEEPEPLVPTTIDPKLIETIIESCTKGKSGLLEGHGSIVFKDGNKYEGNLTKGFMNGKGIYEWKKLRITYSGDFDNNQISGHGKFTWSDGSWYEGEVKEGLRHGVGTYQCTSTPSTYSGEWKNGMRDGKGRLTHGKEGASFVYDGDWKNNYREGHGKLTYPSGNEYGGQWKLDKKHGKGRMQWTSLRQVYDGEWKEGIPHGQGSYYWLKDCDFEKKNRKKNREHEKPEDVVIHGLRNYYSGNWVDGMRDGNGVFYYEDGSNYEGYWKKNMKHGQGKFTYADGKHFEGQFEEDRLTGSQPREKSDGLVVSLEAILKVTGFNCRTKPPQSSVEAGMEDKEPEAKVKLLILRYFARLKDMYLYYSNLGGDTAGEDDTRKMTSLQFSQFLKDCNIPTLHLNLAHIFAQLQKIGENSQLNPANAHHTFLFREFVNSIVLIACLKYPSEADVGNSLSLLFSANIITNAYRQRPSVKQKQRENFLKKMEGLKQAQIESSLDTSVTEVLTTNELLPADTVGHWGIIMDHEKNLLELFRRHAPNHTISLRGLLSMLKERNMLDALLSISKITVLFSDEQGAFSINQELAFHDFLEALVMCCAVRQESAQSFNTKLIGFFARLLK